MELSTVDLSSQERLRDFLQGASPVSFTYNGTSFPAGFSGIGGHFPSSDGTVECDFPISVNEEEATAAWQPCFVAVTEEKTRWFREVCFFDRLFPENTATVTYTAGAEDAATEETVSVGESAFALRSDEIPTLRPAFRLSFDAYTVCVELTDCDGWVARFDPVPGGIRVRVLREDGDFRLMPGEQVCGMRVTVRFC